MNQKVYITSFNSLSPLGRTRKDFDLNLMNGTNGITKLAENEEIKKIFGIGFLGLIPGQHLIDSSQINNEKLISQRDEYINELIAPLSILSEVDDLILVHNAGATVPSYFYQKKLEKSYLFQSTDLATFHSEDFIFRLKKEKKLNEKCNVINFHNTCSSGTAAMVYAWKRIRAKISKKVLVIAFEVSNHNYYTLNSLSSLGVMNVKTQNLDEAMIPFDTRRAGFVKADALAYTMIEGSDGCLENPFAEIMSGALSCDANSLTDGIESGEAVASIMKQCLDLSGISASQVDYINAHGSSTFLNDSIELKGIKKLFHENKKLVVSSTKSHFGHALCATGLVEINSIASMFKNNFVVGNLNHESPEDGFGFHIPKRPLLNTNVTFAIKNSFGFGGYNSSVLLKNLCQ